LFSSDDLRSKGAIFRVKLVFLGTRGNTDITSPRHRRHSSTLIAYRGRAVMVDCGADWRDEVWRLRPPAIVLTHAHPDHAWGLRDGAPCPVFATAESWGTLQRFNIAERRTIAAREPFTIQGIRFEAFPVAHAILAPAVGYRVTAGAVTIFYVPDLVTILDQAAALVGISLYVGDGATLTRSMVRRRGDVLIGHTPMATQLTWCRQEGVRRAIFTHCGSQIIRGESHGIAQQLHALAANRGVRVEIAFDGMELVLR
jgi:phosphoribosyl 1,2-cyclic phosphodiesterase